MVARVKGWENFQHYKNRRPPWIRLYRDILEDPDFHELDGDDFKALVMIWLIASEDPNLVGELPDSKKLAFRLRITEKKLTALLKRLDHWILSDDSDMLADCQQDAIPDQREREIRGEGDQRRGRKPSKKQKTTLPENWTPNEKHEHLANEQGVNFKTECDKFKDYALSNNWKKADWDATFRNWLRKAGEYQSSGSRGSILSGFNGERLTPQEEKQRRNQSIIEATAERLRRQQNELD